MKNASYLILFLESIILLVNIPSFAQNDGNKMQASRLEQKRVVQNQEFRSVINSSQPEMTADSVTIKSMDGSVDVTIAPDETKQIKGVWVATSINPTSYEDNIKEVPNFMNYTTDQVRSLIIAGGLRVISVDFTLTADNDAPNGDYTIKVEFTFRDDGGNIISTDILTINLMVSNEIKADFTGSPRQGQRSLYVEFEDQSTGSITSWEWDFGDGNTSDEQNPSHWYWEPGSFTVKLKVTGHVGSDTEIKSDFITVTPPPPVANFTGSPTKGFAPLLVQFTDNSTGTITNWEWDFGDGNSSTLTNPSHTYQNAGSYTVRLTVSGPGGSNTKTRADYIEVSEKPSIAVTSPNGGENWDEGSTQEITWTSQNTSGYVKISYSTNAGGLWSTIVSSMPDSGSYPWTIPDVNSDQTQCLIKVEDTANSDCYDNSNANFTILNKTMPPNIVVTPDTLFFSVGDTRLSTLSPVQISGYSGRDPDLSTRRTQLINQKRKKTFLPKNEFVSPEEGDTLNNPFEGPFYIFKEQYQTEFEATKLIPTATCTLKALIHDFANFDTENENSKECEFYVWSDKAGVPGNQLLTFTQTITLEADWWGWLSFNVSDYELILNGPFWMGHREKTAGYPTSMADSIVTPGTNFYSDDGISWVEDNWDYLHKAVVAYVEQVPENEDVATLIVNNTGEETLTVSDIIYAETWIAEVSHRNFVLASGAEQAVQVRVSAEGLSAGQYSGDLTILSNDPDTPQYTVFMVFDVLEKKMPKIEVPQGKIHFFVSSNETISNATITVNNIGRDTLKVTNIDADASWVINISPKEFSVEPGGMQNVNLSAKNINRLLDDTYTGTLTIFSNDPEKPALQVEMEFEIATLVEGFDRERGIPLKFELSQNYPNPFNPQTSIEFGLQRKAEVSIQILNVSAQLVKTLLNQTLKAGYHTVVWDATNDRNEKVPSGIYFLKISNGNEILMKKMIFAK